MIKFEKKHVEISYWLCLPMIFLSGGGVTAWLHIGGVI